MRTRTALLVALTVAAGACTGASAEPLASTTTAATEPSTTTSVTTTTLVPTTTTTTVPPPPTSLINGTLLEDPTLVDRQVLAVKIDNHRSARPQSGIESADMVIELMVEELTRFITIWHESDSSYLGPIRSARPTDSTLLRAMNEPTFAISGAQDWIYEVLRSKDIHMLGEGEPGIFRIKGRRPPHNLYVDTNLLRVAADAYSYPTDPPGGPIWPFGPMSEYTDVVSQVRIDFSGNIVRWTWDAEGRLWLRTVGGNDSTWVDEEGETGRIGVPVLVALYVDQYTARPPGLGQPVPASRTLGSGKAFVFAEGRVSEGTWTRDSEFDWFTLSDPRGETILVPPGRVWVSLVPSHRGLTYTE